MSVGPNLADQAYRKLESMIVFRELAPGSLVSEAMLMDRTGFGRTPVREAVQRLARDQMVDIHPRRGIFIAGMSLESQLQQLEVRRGLEQVAVRLAAQRATPQQRQQMLALCDELSEFKGDDIAAFGPLLARSHRLVTEAARNDYLLIAMAPVQGLSRRFWFANLHDVEAGLRAGADLHVAILTALGAADARPAGAASPRPHHYPG